MKYLAMAAVRLYQVLLSPLFANSCKYHPSCSQYALDALRQYGLLRGSVLTVWRLLRCNPWSRGGVDYAKDQRLFRDGRTQGSLVSPLRHAVARPRLRQALAGRSPAPPTAGSLAPSDRQAR
jgi:uncharacterized protein